MAYDARTILAHATDDGRAVGERVAAWCHRGTIKDIARQLGVEPRTVRHWREGNMPSGHHLTRMARAWGSAFLTDVFAPVVESEDDVLQRLEHIKHDLEITLGRLHEQAADHQSAAGNTRSRIARTARSARHTIAVALCLMASGLATYAADEMRTTGRYGGRPPVVRVRGGREV